MNYLGVDIGSSGCKAAVFDASGRCLGTAHRAYAMLRPGPGRVELDSGGVIDGCLAAMAEAARECGAVRALAISSQGEAFTPVDAAGNCLGNAMISSDSRAQELLDAAVEEFGAERLYRITGHTPSAMFSLFKLLWLKQNQPEIQKKAARFLCFEDLLMFRLGVDPAMGWPLAGRTMLFDVNTHTWSREILDFAGLDESRLARPLPSGTVAGTVAAGFGPLSGAKVVTGGHDQVLGALGAGVVEPGRAMYAAGSVECLCPVLPGLTLDDRLRRNNLCCYDYALPGRYTSVAYSLTGSNLLQYFKEQFARETSYEELVRELPEGPTELLALPYFTPSGTPYFDARTPGAVLGWRLSTSRGELLKALLEGIALEMKLNLSLLEESGMAIGGLTATGGGCRHRPLVQLKADVLGKPIGRIEVGEAGCRGAALLAQGADTGRPVEQLAAREPGPVVEPDPERAERYRRKFAQYREFYRGVRDLSAATAGR